MGPLQKHLFLDPPLHVLGSLIVVGWWQIVEWLHPYLWAGVVFILSLFASILGVLIVSLIQTGFHSVIGLSKGRDWTILPLSILMILTLLASSGIGEAYALAAEEGKEADLNNYYLFLFWGNVATLLITWLIATVSYFRR